MPLAPVIHVGAPSYALAHFLHQRGAAATPEIRTVLGLNKKTPALALPSLAAMIESNRHATFLFCNRAQSTISQPRTVGLSMTCKYTEL